MMEDESKSAYSCNKQKSFFFQLRHLAGEVDSKVHFVKEQLVSKSSKLEPCQDQASANLFLMNTKKELSSTFEQVKTKYNVFDSCSNDFHRIQELIKSVLCVHKKRVGKMQDFMECYGYVKPVIEPSMLTALKGSQPESHKDIESSQSDDGEDEDNIEESVSATPQAKANMEAKDKMEKQLIKTPKLEDLYGKLSENTLFLLKGAKSNSDNADLDTMQLSNYSLSSVRNKTYSTPFDSQKAEGKFGFNSTSTCKERTDNANNFITNIQTNTDYKPEIKPTGKDVFQITQSMSDMSEMYAKHGTSLRTPESMIKSKEQKKTPVFEDVYSMLSECTISLLRNTSHKSVSAENLSEKLLTSVLDSPRDIPVLSEESVLLKPNDKSLSESSLQNCSQWTISSLKDCSITNAMSQSIQTTFPKETARCGNSYNSADEIKIPKCARTLLYTQPPVSENTIRFTTSYRQMASAGKENDPAVSLFDSMPASPKLLSSALIQDIYNNKY